MLVVAVVVGVMVVRQSRVRVVARGVRALGRGHDPRPAGLRRQPPSTPHWLPGRPAPTPIAYVETKALLEDPIDDARVVWIGDVDGATTAVVRQKIALTSSGYHDEDLEGGETGYVFAFLRADEDGMTVRSVHIDWGSSVARLARARRAGSPPTRAWPCCSTSGRR